jgi:hypothetical protein
MNYSTASADDTEFEDDRIHTAELRGSFVSNFTGSHNFELWSAIYEPLTPQSLWTKFTFDEVDRGTHKDKWQWNITLMKDFRYQMRLTVQNKSKTIQMSISVEYAEHSMSILDGNLISRCEESGCRDTELSQLPYSCHPSPSLSLSLSPTLSVSPSPTHSHTPTSTQSQTLSPTESHSLSPTHSHTPTLTRIQTPSPTESHSPSPTHSDSPTPTQSCSPVASASLTFHLSSALSESFIIFQSHKFDESHRLSLSLTFRESSVIVCDSPAFLDSFEFTLSNSFLDSPAETVRNDLIGLIAGIVSSLAIGIVCLIVFLIVKKNRKQNETSKSILHQDLDLDEDDHTSIVTMTMASALSEDTLPTRLLSVTHPSDCYDQSSLDGQSLFTNRDM